MTEFINISIQGHFAYALLEEGPHHIWEGDSLVSVEFPNRRALRKVKATIGSLNQALHTLKRKGRGAGTVLIREVEVPVGGGENISYQDLLKVSKEARKTTKNRLDERVAHLHLFMMLLEEGGFWNGTHEGEYVNSSSGRGSGAEPPFPVPNYGPEVFE